jgi:hypothetical protein
MEGSDILIYCCTIYYSWKSRRIKIEEIGIPIYLHPSFIAAKLVKNSLRGIGPARAEDYRAALSNIGPLKGSILDLPPSFPSVFERSNRRGRSSGAGFPFQNTTTKAAIL